MSDEAELDAALRGSGLRVVDTAQVSDLPGSRPEWDEAADAVEAVVEREHGHEEGYRVSQRNEQLLGRLIGDSLVVGRLRAGRVDGRR